MNRVTLEQISQLSNKEQRRVKACLNQYLGEQRAAQKRRKKVMTERTKIELGVKDDNFRTQAIRSR